MSIESVSAVRVLSGVGGIMAVDTVSSAPVEIYEKLGIIGLLVIAVYVLWLADQRRQSKLEKIIEENTKAMTEVRDVLRFCQQKNSAGK